MKRIKTLLACLIILIGWGLVFLPILKDKYNENRYESLRKEFDKAMDFIESSPEPVIIEVTLPSEDGQVVFETMEIIPYEPIREFESGEDVEAIVYTKEERDAYLKKAFPVEGVLKIEAIELDMLVIDGASLTHLDFSISSLGYGKPWSEGNYSIAGHRSLNYGKHFNRLNELVVGHMISFVDLNGNSYNYEIYETKIVHESDYKVLDDNGFKEITLITCDPIGEKNPEYRLIVKGRITDQ
jgi:sortase A